MTTALSAEESSRGLSTEGDGTGRRIDDHPTVLDPFGATLDSHPVELPSNTQGDSVTRTWLEMLEKYTGPLADRGKLVELFEAIMELKVREESLRCADIARQVSAKLSCHFSPRRVGEKIAQMIEKGRA
jgi:hypothetical protein